MDAKDNTVNGEDPDFDEEELHHIGGDRGRIDEGKITLDMDGHRNDIQGLWPRNCKWRGKSHWFGKSKKQRWRNKQPKA